MSLAVSVDSSAPEPPSEQIRSQISGLITAGELAPGTRLPTVRQLARDLRLAPGTVARAFKQLESAGLVTTRRGAGTRVADQPPLPQEARGELLAQTLAPALDRVVALGFSPKEILQAAQDHLDGT